MTVIRNLRLEYSQLPNSDLIFVMKEFRVMVNKCIREANSSGKTAKGSLSKFAQKISKEHKLSTAFGYRAAEVALGIMAGHRKAKRKNKDKKIELPYVRKMFTRFDDKNFHIDYKTGKIRLSIGNGKWTSINVALSEWHLTEISKGQIKQLVILPTHALVVIEKLNTEQYKPLGIVALDTNESSIDGVSIQSKSNIFQMKYADIPLIQNRHFERRRKLQKKKSHDARVKRRLLQKEGNRERNRVKQRLHKLSKNLVQYAYDMRLAIILEDLSFKPDKVFKKYRTTKNRKLSSWPRTQLHNQITYKAEEKGVPVIFVNPAYTSRTCPKCGDIQKHRTRTQMFTCEKCNWKLDKQVNAGINIGLKAIRENDSLKGLRLDLDGLVNDAMKSLYDPKGRTDGTDGEKVTDCQLV